MINIRDLRIDPRCLGDSMLLVDIVPTYEYQNKQRTEKVVGYRYVVALPSMGLEKLGIKIDGEKRLEKPEGYSEVKFENLEIGLYEAQGHVNVTAKASGIHLAKKPQ